MPARPSRALRFHITGEPTAVLREDLVEVPDPPAGTVRVRTLATGLNPADGELCRGYLPGPLPRGIGFDVVGTVDAVGPGVDADRARVGDVVVGSADLRRPSAGAAEVAVLDAWTRLPDGLEPVRAAALPMVVQTAAWTLEVLHLEPGTTLLVHGAGGMVGYAAVQMALERGIRVLATAGPTLRPDLEGFGARVTGYGPGMVDRVRDLTGGAAVEHVLDTSRPTSGVIADLVTLAGGEPGRVMTISNHAEARALGARVNLDALVAGLPSLPGLLDRYAERAADGRFRLPVAAAVPFSRWTDAVELLFSGAPHGKVVLVPDA